MCSNASYRLDVDELQVLFVDMVTNRSHSFELEIARFPIPSPHSPTKDTMLCTSASSQQHAQMINIFILTYYCITTDIQKQSVPTGFSSELWSERCSSQARPHQQCHPWRSSLSPAAPAPEQHKEPQLFLPCKHSHWCNLLLF